MELHHLLSLFIVIIIFIQQNHSSLLSRFKSAYTYQPVQVDLDETPLELEEMEERDPKMFRDLLEELPEFKEILNARRKNSSQRTFYFAPPNHTDADEENQGNMTTRSMRENIVKLFKNNNTSRTSTIRHQMIMQSNRSKSEIYPRNYTGRRFLEFPDGFMQINLLDPFGHYKGYLRSTCYECGNAAGIPHSSLCHDAFDSPNWKARTLARYFRTKCYYNEKNYYVYEKVKIEHITELMVEHPFLTRFDKGATRHLYFKGFAIKDSCFKRFLDVGSIYTQRGCQAWPPYFYEPRYMPQQIYNHATHRYRALEYTMQGSMAADMAKFNIQYPKKEQCVFSPAASLTPFARGISLFARYHVCFCKGRYCNSANSGTPSNLLIFLACTILIYFNF